MHIANNTIFVQNNHQLLGNKIECLVFHCLRNPDSRILGYPDFTFDNGYIGSVQILRTT